MIPIAEAVIVVPSIAVDDLLIRCVTECRVHHPDTEVIVVVDDPTDAHRVNGIARVVTSASRSIGAKRNQAVAVSDSRYVAFIDSDAYPAEGWLTNAVRILDSRSDLAVVGGPNVSPPQQTGWEWAVGRAHRSVLVDGWWNFRKNPDAVARDVSDLPSCNMVIRRSDYELVGGMNEELFSAEDIDLCIRLIASGRYIHFTPDVLVFHKDRGLTSFVVQRFTFGVAMLPLLRRGSRPRMSYIAISVAISLFVLFLALGPLAYRIRSVRLLWLSLVCTYALVVSFEAARLTRGRKGLFRVVTMLVIGNLTPGVGLLVEAFRLTPELYGLYRNDRGSTHPGRSRATA